MRSVIPGLAILVLLCGCAAKEDPEVVDRTAVEEEQDSRFGLPEGKSSCSTWNAFEMKTADNVLDDFSYAGYDHGMTCPPEVAGLGYKVFDVCDYGAVPDDGKSDRDAFLKCLEAAFGSAPARTKNEVCFTAPADAGVVIYFPEGEFILHTEEDNVKCTDGYYNTLTIRIDGGGFVLKGAGRDKTRIVIKDPLLPANHQTYVVPSAGMYSSAWLMNLGQTAVLDPAGVKTSGVLISGSSVKGSHKVTLSSASGFSAGDWCCMRAEIKDQEYLRNATSRLTLGSWDIKNTGVILREYHQIASVDGDAVTFVEPLLADVDSTFEFRLFPFKPNRGIGVEDMTFVGQNVNDFTHHLSWVPDGAYKTLEFNDCVDSWMRRCNFESVSEIVLFSFCANCSAYDLNLYGWRGHNNARVARCSWNFFGKIKDTSDGLVHKIGYVAPYKPRNTLEGAGSYHGPGVAYESSGNVFWRCQWGKDAGFEAHGRQSRNNLWDACTGGFLSNRQGGGKDDMPNHMGGLVFWNFKSFNDWRDFSWWSDKTSMYVVKPVIVGMHGGNVTFTFGTTTVDESNGTPVDVGSLYEAQLRLRLGEVPAWINSIKYQ